MADSRVNDTFPAATCQNGTIRHKHPNIRTFICLELVVISRQAVQFTRDGRVCDLDLCVISTLTG